ncbi:DUF6713 family protein [Pseudanabaena sp. FACHB-2040]|uniref:DUF6713 family protein n=1 Tax=Pseudanabaena sp. FACHB-2040 TaxID=2692859 RepID=UPI001685AF36|nr:DUF6713 family protein [Pseudanabaena sp. FACHB-2040]MBD2259407.1 hypothetical protein [Pseudanabaena sp. FACHB-2040]
MKDLIFNLGFATLATHELDAVTQSEWRLLYILRSLPEPTASTAFVAIHVPLLAVLFWLTFNDNLSIRAGSRAVFAAFWVIHAGLHKALENHPLYTFHSPLSQSLIFGCGLLGLLYGVAVYVQRFSDSSPAKVT